MCHLPGHHPRLGDAILATARDFGKGPGRALAVSRASLSGVQLLYVLVGLAGCGWLLPEVGGWYLDHRQGAAKSVGAAAILIGYLFLMVTLAIIWVVRIRHLLRTPGIAETRCYGRQILPGGVKR
jgi:hypothetical protein